MKYKKGDKLVWVLVDSGHVRLVPESECILNEKGFYILKRDITKYFNT